jgi:hypothetical protein
VLQPFVQQGGQHYTQRRGARQSINQIKICAELHHFDAAPALGQENGAAPAPTPFSIAYLKFKIKKKIINFVAAPAFSRENDAAPATATQHCIFYPLRCRGLIACGDLGF